MGKASAPTPPDPKVTAGAQTATNIGTAIANNTMGQVNQVTPNGSLTYSQSGSTKWTDPNTGQVYDLPSYTATQTLSPTEQAANDANQASKLNLANLGNTESQKLAGILGTPVDLSSANVAKYENDFMNPQFNSQWDQKAQQYGTQLSNQGVKLGSSAYDRAMQDFSNQRSSAESQNNSTMYGQAVNSILQQHNQPLNEITALMSGAQVQQPNFANTAGATSNIPTTDIAGLINQNYNQQVAATQAQNAQTGQMMGGLFGLAGKVAPLMF